MSTRALVPASLTFALLAAAVVLLPVDRRLAMEMLIVFAMAQGWNLLSGYTGLISFGHHAFVGLGAYVLYMTVNTLGLSPYLSIGASAAVSLVLGLGMWLLLRHLRGPYFAIGIWVIADSLRLVFSQWDWVGSSRGLVLNPSSIDAMSFTATMFWLALALALGTQAGIYALLRSRRPHLCRSGGGDERQNHPAEHHVGPAASQPGPHPLRDS